MIAVCSGVVEVRANSGVTVAAEAMVLLVDAESSERLSVGGLEAGRL